jgi:hypothetical protein
VSLIKRFLAVFSMPGLHCVDVFERAGTKMFQSYLIIHVATAVVMRSDVKVLKPVLIVAHGGKNRKPWIQSSK